MTPEVHHRIGSVTKTFTATLVLKAAEKGLLSLDDPIDKYASVRLDSFVSDVPPVNEPPLKGDLAYTASGSVRTTAGSGTTARYSVTTRTSSIIQTSTRW
jgi:CubicO group peptidase (beta-lactamase class C family)